jgi:hypothetical protein
MSQMTLSGPSNGFPLYLLCSKYLIPFSNSLVFAGVYVAPVCVLNLGLAFGTASISNSITSGLLYNSILGALPMNKITTQWISWIFATTAAALTMSTYVFGTFPTQQAHDNDLVVVNHRVDKLERRLHQQQKSTNARLRSVHDKVNQIYILLIEDKRK